MPEIKMTDDGPLHIYDSSKNEICPSLEITAIKSWVAGRCYDKTLHRVRSVKKLSTEDLNGWVRKIVEYGQEYYIDKSSDNPVGWFNTTELQAKGYFPVAFYEYEIITGIDSSD